MSSSTTGEPPLSSGPTPDRLLGLPTPETVFEPLPPPPGGAAGPGPPPVRYKNKPTNTDTKARNATPTAMTAIAPGLRPPSPPLSAPPGRASAVGGGGGVGVGGVGPGPGPGPSDDGDGVGAVPAGGGEGLQAGGQQPSCVGSEKEEPCLPD